MTNFNSIWNASIDRAAGLRKKIASFVGETEVDASTSEKREYSAAPGSAVPQAALDHLIIQVSKSVSEAMAEFPLTKSMNFSKSFSSAFTPSPYHKTSPALNSSLTATSIAALAKNIFREASSAIEMTSEEKDGLMTAVLSGVNHGFMTAIDSLTSSDSASGADIDNIENIQNIAQANIGGYYTAASEAEASASPVSKSSTKEIASEELWARYSGISSYLNAPLSRSI